MEENLAALGKMRILYVEDDEMTREEVAPFLRRYALEVEDAADGQAGLALYREHEFDIVVTDIRMPRMGGLELSEKILAEDPRAVIVILSAFNESEYLFKAIELGIHHYLPKPINLRQLLTVMAKIALQLSLERELDEKRAALESINAQLQLRIAEEVEKNRIKDRLLHTQSKNAQMGEMLNMIAHQWRQPLNAISASAIKISMLDELGELSRDMMLEHARFVQEQSQKMSQTINDFMEFFKPHEGKSRFTLTSLMDELGSLISAQLKNRGIELRYDRENRTEIASHEKELAHVLLNLIANARDAFESGSVASPCIAVALERTSPSTVVITVSDNAGGISEANLDKVFNLYFTTKEQGKGTGIGLYMSRRIVEEVLGGTIEVANRGEGACFTIAFEG